MTRHRLTDEQWGLIDEEFEPYKGTGRPPTDRRTSIEGIFWILSTGAPWRDLPKEFGSFSTIWGIFNQWNSDGTLERILNKIRQRQTIDNELWCIDGSVVRAARCSSGGGKKTTWQNRKTTHLAEVAVVSVQKCILSVIGMAILLPFT